MPAKKRMRKYQPIWEELKASRVCSVNCAISVRARVIKAVTKEKDMDTEFKDTYGLALTTRVLKSGDVEFKLITVSPWDKRFK